MKMNNEKNNLENVPQQPQAGFGWNVQQGPSAPSEKQ
jgi:hypothetical protein